MPATHSTRARVSYFACYVVVLNAAYTAYAYALVEFGSDAVRSMVTYTGFT